MPAAPFTCPIALVGMPGAGKSTIGAALARRLGWPFRDSDAEIERETGLTIAELFERDGEAAFRERERAVIDRLLDGRLVVLASGGGAFAQPVTRRLLLARATTVWLDADPETLASRIKYGAARPLLGRDPIAALRGLSERRRSSYAMAAIRIDAGASPDRIVEAIIAALPR